MTELIRNCVHHSSHNTYLERVGDGPIASVRKVSCLSEGVADLRRELDGLRWYCAKVGVDPATVILEEHVRDGYGRIRLSYQQGSMVTVPVKPGKIIGRLGALLQHYLDVFGPDDYGVSQGDFSVCNHVFDQQSGQVRWIIDWEHFNRTLPPGYDIVYALAEPMLFWINNDHRPDPSEVAATKSLLAKAQEAVGFDQAVLAAPAQWLRDSAGAHKAVWGGQHKKVPFLAASEDAIATLDRLLAQ